MGCEPSASYLPGRPTSSTHPGSESCRIKSKQLLRWPAEQVSGCHLGLRLAAAPKSLGGPTGNGRILGRPGTVQSWSVHREDKRQRNTKTAAVCRAKRRLVLFERVWRLPPLFAWGFKRWQWWCFFSFCLQILPSSFLYKLSFVPVTRGKKYHKWDPRYVTCNTNHKINCIWFI